MAQTYRGTPDEIAAANYTIQERRAALVKYRDLATRVAEGHTLTFDEREGLDKLCRMIPRQRDMFDRDAGIIRSLAQARENLAKGNFDFEALRSRVAEAERLEREARDALRQRQRARHIATQALGEACAAEYKTRSIPSGAPHLFLPVEQIVQEIPETRQAMPTGAGG